MTGLYFELGVSLLTQTVLAASGVRAIPLDARGFCRADLFSRVLPAGAVAGTNGVQWDIHRVLARDTVATALVSTGTSITVSADFAAFVMVGDQIVIENEVVIVSAKAANVLTISALVRSHAAGTLVYLMVITPGSTFTMNTFVAATLQGREYTVGNGDFVVVATNLDATNAVTIDLAWTKV